MSDLVTTSVRLPKHLKQLLGDLSDQSAADDEIPTLSESAFFRIMLHDSASHLFDGEMDVGDLEQADVTAEDVRDLVPEHTQILYQRERFKDGPAQVRNLRTGFEARVKRHFKSRFQGGFKPEQLDEWAVNMKMDAKILFPPTAGDDDEDPHAERREECINYVEALVEEAKNAADASSYDPLDPEEAFSNYGGVEEGREREEAADVAVDVVTDVANRLEKLRGKADPDGVVRAVAKKHGLAEERVREIVEQVRNGDAPEQLEERDDEDVIALAGVSDD